MTIAKSLDRILSGGNTARVTRFVGGTYSITLESGGVYINLQLTQGDMLGIAAMINDAADIPTVIDDDDWEPEITRVSYAGQP